MSSRIRIVIKLSSSFCDTSREVKSGSEKTEYEANKKRYNGTNTSLFNEVYAKELGFLDFQKINKDFEYKVIFDAHLQERQRELFELIKKL